MAVTAVESEGEIEEYHSILKTAGDRLPKPQGWKILIAVPKAVDKTDGGIYKPNQVLQYEEVGSIVGLVVKLGDLAYKDRNKFPGGKWCHQGDYIIMRSYSGTRIQVGDQEFRLINDDTVEAVVDDPRGVMKIL
jgi:co-chaperonin GroES (HSP10)